LSDDATVVIDQLRAVTCLENRYAQHRAGAAIETLRRWCRPDPLSASTTPGGAASCNLWALASLVAASSPSSLGNREGAGPPEEILRPVVARLAEASVADPRYEPAVSNLALLFGELGDSARAAIASDVAESLRKEPRNRR
jgi:hypothetical protein